MSCLLHLVFKEPWMVSSSVGCRHVRHPPRKSSVTGSTPSKSLSRSIVKPVYLCVCLWSVAMERRPRIVGDSWHTSLHERSVHVPLIKLGFGTDLSLGRGAGLKKYESMHDKMGAIKSLCMHETMLGCRGGLYLPSSSALRRTMEYQFRLMRSCGSILLLSMAGTLPIGRNLLYYVNRAYYSSNSR